MSYHQVLVSKELGGAGLIGLQLAAGVRDRGQKSQLWIPGDGPAAAKAEQMGLLWQRYSFPTVGESRFKGLLRNLDIARMLRVRRPRLIHVHSPLHYGAMSLGLKMARLRTIAHVHIEEEKEGLRWALERPPDVIIICARFLVEHVRSVLPEHYRDQQQIIAVPNAVDTERFRPGDKMAAKSSVGIDTKVPLILMVANIAPHKGHKVALRTAAVLKSYGLTAHFWFAGTERGSSQEYTTELRSLAKDLGVYDRVKFLGHREDVPELMRAADVFLLPSTAEGLPLSILESQASGTPVLAAPTAGIPEIVVHGKTGYLVEGDNPAGYAHHILDLLDNPNHYVQISKCARRAVTREHNWKSYVEKIWDIYQRLAVQ